MIQHTRLLQSCRNPRIMFLVVYRTHMKLVCMLHKSPRKGRCLHLHISCYLAVNSYVSYCLSTGGFSSELGLRPSNTRLPTYVVAALTEKFIRQSSPVSSSSNSPGAGAGAEAGAGAGAGAGAEAQGGIAGDNSAHGVGPDRGGSAVQLTDELMVSLRSCFDKFADATAEDTPGGSGGQAIRLMTWDGADGGGVGRWLITINRSTSRGSEMRAAKAILDQKMAKQSGMSPCHSIISMRLDGFSAAAFF